MVVLVVAVANWDGDSTMMLVWLFSLRWRLLT